MTHPSTGRRPLSALGLVHVFQRRHLVRRWHEDFPLIHSEGGLPGSDSAGIVAFIRERLVDLGDVPLATSNDQPVVEPLVPKDEGLDEAGDTANGSIPGGQKSSRRLCSTSTQKEAGYILDEIPLINVDLGLREILQNTRKFGS